MMYFMDRLLFDAAVDEARTELKSAGKKVSAKDVLAKNRTFDVGDNEYDVYQDHSISCSDSADDFGILHSYNKDWLEIRTWNNDIRGIFSLLGVFLYSIFGGAGLFIVYNMIHIYLTGINPASGIEFDESKYFSMTFFSIASCILIVGFFWFCNKFFRYELFTHRWIRLRFNRKTQKVYILRPAFAGGFRVFDWRQTEPGMPKDKNPDAPNLHWGVLSWDNQIPGEPLIAQFVGRRTSFKTNADWLAFWEFIRRYMEEGPQSVPAPKSVIGYGPSLKEAWISITQWYPALQQKGAIGRISDGITLLILPLIVLMVVGNFLGQCLTWNARFPKEIEDAGKA